jgi:hypothetical protein
VSFNPAGKASPPGTFFNHSQHFLLEIHSKNAAAIAH